MRRLLLRLAATAAIAAGCLGSAAHADPLQPQSQFNLGLTGPEIPEILQKAKADVYAAPAQPVCQSLPAEIDALNQVLGADADQAEVKRSNATKATNWMGGAVRGLIPHRDVIRFITGAGKKDDRLRDAALAGWARRGYLKGLAKTLDCTIAVAAIDVARPAATLESHPFAPLPEAAGDARAIDVSPPLPAPEIAPEPLDSPPAS